ncbi:MAG: hypothetical protein CL927_14100 [Deltaproteobacteria bacterium]|nr:hypothetical protein [Deltaproteobacteria bacterium]HCH64107.1 DUF952 domain-containing protein [Deltaproteobacteria bacterium]
MTAPRDPSGYSRVYKIVDATQLQALRSSAAWRGAPIDLSDGFVHFSAHDQVMGTLRKHFAGRTQLHVLELSIERIDADRLRWEVSRNGDLFPHLYGPMRSDMVVEAHAVVANRDGSFEALVLQP